MISCLHADIVFFPERRVAPRGEAALFFCYTFTFDAGLTLNALYAPTRIQPLPAFSDRWIFHQRIGAIIVFVA